MKTIIISVLIVICLMSCKDDMKSNLETELIEVSIEGTEIYTYKIAEAIPVEGGYEIRRQAKNYQISKMKWGEYNFQAKEGFTGTERIEIVLSTSIGDNNFTDQKKWIFIINIE